MRIEVIASSSRGNGYLITDSHSTLLVECGVNIDKLQKHIADLSKIDGCLITHEHNDHSKSAKEIIAYTKVYASNGTINEIMERQKIKDYNKHDFKTLKAGRITQIGTFTVLPFDVQHDAKEPLGFLIYSKITRKKILFATDTYYIKPRFNGLNIIMIECNFAKDLLPDNLEKVRKDRLLKSHFELGNVKEFLKANDLKNVEQIYLMHLSNGHSDAERFKKEIQELSGIQRLYVRGDILKVRKGLTKKTRFEVFKRDGFTCQYCGKMAPDIVLEVDHIKPVSKGGTNDFINLITSCRDCNRGKGKRKLSNKDVIKKQQEQLKELNKKREQLEMMVDWQNELLNLEQDYLSELKSFFSKEVNFPITKHGDMLLKKWLDKYGFGLLLDSMKKSISQYLELDDDGRTEWESAQKIFEYIPKICKNTLLQEKDPQLKNINYILKILRNKFGYLNNSNYWRCKELIRDLLDVITFEEIKRLAQTFHNINRFMYEAEEILYKEE